MKSIKYLFLEPMPPLNVSYLNETTYTALLQFFVPAFTELDRISILLEGLLATAVNITCTIPYHSSGYFSEYVSVIPCLLNNLTAGELYGVTATTMSTDISSDPYTSNTKLTLSTWLCFAAYTA